MYFITKKTGLKFQELEKKVQLAIEADKKLAEKYGFNSWRGASLMLRGGFSSLKFETPPDTNIYKEVRKGEWMPRLNTKQGKEIQKELDSSPRVSRDELNMCIGWDGFPFYNIGFARGNDEYYGFIVEEDWEVNIPNDCEEVTTTQFNKMFN